MIKSHRRNHATTGLLGPVPTTRRGYTEEMRAKQIRAQTGKPHPQYRQQCSCGKVTTPGPMRMHTKATEHYVAVLRLPRA